MQFKSQWITRGIANLSQRQFNTIMRNNLKKVAEYWHDNFMPRRFTAAGQNVYHLKQRSSRYIKKALRKNPEWRPLVLTGKLMNSVMTNWRPLATATNNKLNARVKMVRTHATQAYVAAEIIKTNKNEIVDLQKYFKENTLADIKKIKPRKMRIS